jgi:hypothetical protein
MLESQASTRTYCSDKNVEGVKMPPTSTWNEPTLKPIFEGASTDDLLWLNPVSVDQLTSFIRDPNRFIGDLNKLSLEADEERKITMRPDFALRMQLRNRPQRMDPDRQPYLIQGIVGTNLITVRPRVGLEPQVSQDWDDYWKEWHEKAELLITVDTDFNQGYAHMELTHPDDPSELRADKIAAFIIRGTDPRVPFDTFGTPLNAIMNKKPKFFTLVGSEGTKKMLATGPMLGDVTSRMLPNINFTLLANANDLTSTPGVVGNREPACDNKAGRWNGERILVDDITVKNYPKPGP